MGLGGCIILIAVGAILTFATDWDMQGVNLDLVGVILMIVGLIGVDDVQQHRPAQARGGTARHAEVVEEERHRAPGRIHRRIRRLSRIHRTTLSNP